MQPTLVAVAHGSRDPRAPHAVEALLDRVRELRPRLDVRLGHIELNRPLLGDALREVSGAAVLVPLLLGRGHHVKRDLPASAARAAHLRTRIAAPLGPHPLLVEALYDRLLEAGWTPGAAVVLAAAGSRDPDSAADTRRSAALLSERLGGVAVVAAYACAAAPTRTRNAPASFLVFFLDWIICTCMIPGMEWDAIPLLTSTLVITYAPLLPL
ncbi:CbiX/SirB N-terminal domain-containing protein, partial [Streptomyces sp. Mg1]|uniref:sirohydrochlorin chelatase n=1 Tax=Streptomyces sp. Mg1 TaxID=465541 RepID=UPI00017F26A4